MVEKKRIKQKDIADILGLSVSQVSRALSNKGEVSKETREKILKLAGELGYTHNLIAQSLRSSKTKTLGVIQPDLSNPFFSVLVRGIEYIAQKMGYSIMVSNTYESFNTERKLINNMLDRGVDGLLIVPVRAKSLKKSHFTKDNVPVILLARCIRNGEIHCVVGDDLLGGYLATKHLINKGHRKILYFSGPEDMIASMDRMKGYKKALEDYNVLFSEKMVHTVGTTMRDGYTYMKGLLENDRYFTAVFSFNDVLSYGCLHAFREKSIRVPQDVAIVGYDDTEINVVLNPQLTCIHQPTYEMGVEATKLILNLIGSEDTIEPKTILFKPVLRVREST